MDVRDAGRDLPHMETVAEVLGLLVPAGGGLPSAGDLRGLPGALLSAVARWPALGEGAVRVLQTYEARTRASVGTSEKRVAVLMDLERRDEEGFRALLTLCYGLYYANPQVAVALERRYGYPARPPQPLGYRLPPFNHTLLAPQRERAPFWRPG